MCTSYMCVLIIIPMTALYVRECHSMLQPSLVYRNTIAAGRLQLTGAKDTQCHKQAVPVTV